MYIVQVIVRSWGAMVYGICTFEGVYVIPRAKPEDLALVAYSALVSLVAHGSSTCIIFSERSLTAIYLAI